MGILLSRNGKNYLPQVQDLALFVAPALLSGRISLVHEPVVSVHAGLQTAPPFRAAGSSVSSSKFCNSDLSSFSSINNFVESGKELTH